jgi:hypothetical protein
MKERPILFSGEMVRAILAGRKTQTRRVVKPTQSTPKVAPLTMYPYVYDGYQQEDDDGLPCWIGEHPDYPHEGKWFSCPHGGIGDRLWVRETFCVVDGTPDYRATPRYSAERPGGWENDPDDPSALHWHPSIYMPRALSRITLTITDVRVEQVQSISEADAIAEGIIVRAGHMSRPLGSKEPSQPVTHVQNYSALWDTLNERRGYGWDTNPFVWVVSFEVV